MTAITDETHFHHDTPEKVRRALENARRSGERVRLFYGDIATGKAEPEEFNTCGRVSRSMGPKMRCPILIANRASSGGPLISDDRIVAIKTANGWVYQHPNFDVGEWRGQSIPETSELFAEGYRWEVLHNGTVHARFKGGMAQALRYVDFMQGKRLAR